MRVAVLTDPHSNLPALQAVLRDVEDAEVDVVGLAGDLAAGRCPPRPSTRWSSWGSGAAEEPASEQR